jgi:hypothetical protein
MSQDTLFEVLTPLGFAVRVSTNRWELIVTTKHPVMRGREGSVQNTVGAPDEIRRSRSDPAVYLFYRRECSDRWTCAVAKRLNDEAFLITAYPTDRIKEGERIWSR